MGENLIPDANLKYLEIRNILKFLSVLGLLDML